MTPATLLPPAAALSAIVVGDFTSKISLGSVIVLLATVAAAAWLNVTKKADREQLVQNTEQWKESAEAWREERDAERQKVDRLIEDLTEERRRCDDALADVARLTERNDVGEMRRQLSAEHREILGALRAVHSGLDSLTTAVTALGAGIHGGNV